MTPCDILLSTTIILLPSYTTFFSFGLCLCVMLLSLMFCGFPLQAPLLEDPLEQHTPDVTPPAINYTTLRVSFHHLCLLDCGCPGASSRTRIIVTIVFADRSLFASRRCACWGKSMILVIPVLLFLKNKDLHGDTQWYF